MNKVTEANKASEQPIYTTLDGSRTITEITIHTLMYGIYAICFSLDSSLLFVGQHDNISVHDVESGKQIRTLYAIHTNNIQCIRMSKYGRLLLTASNDKTCKLVDWDAQIVIMSFKGHNHNVTDVHFGFTEKFIYTASLDCTLKVWNASTGECVRTFIGHTDWVRKCLVSYDDEFLVSAGYDRIIILWNINSDAIQKIIFQAPFILSLQWVNRIHFLSGNHDGTITLFSWPACEVVRTFKEHSSWVLSINVACDGLHFLTGSADQTINLWRIDVADPIISIKKHTICYRNVCTSPNGKYIVSASEEGKIISYKVSPSFPNKRDIFNSFQSLMLTERLPRSIKLCKHLMVMLARYVIY